MMKNRSYLTDFRSKGGPRSKVLTTTSSPPPGAPSYLKTNSKNNNPITSFKAKIKRHRDNSKLNSITELPIISPRAKKWILGVLTMFNFLNYVDRYTIISIADTRLKCDFGLKDKDLGWLQPSFYVAYMLISPLVGYLGGKHSRRNIISCGIVIWCAFFGGF